MSRPRVTAFVVTRIARCPLAGRVGRVLLGRMSSGCKNWRVVRTPAPFASVAGAARYLAAGGGDRGSFARSFRRGDRDRPPGRARRSPGSGSSSRNASLTILRARARVVVLRVPPRGNPVRIPRAENLTHGSLDVR